MNKEKRSFKNDTEICLHLVKKQVNLFIPADIWEHYSLVIWLSLHMEPSARALG